MTLPGFVAESALVPAPVYRSIQAPQPTGGPVRLAYDAGDCYDDCMAGGGKEGPGRRRFARFCAVACG